MIDFIDPTLKSSVERKKNAEKSFARLSVYILILIIVILTIWVFFSVSNSRIDTKQDNRIDINGNLQSTQVPDRLEPIQNTR